MQEWAQRFERGAWQLSGLLMLGAVFVVAEVLILADQALQGVLPWVEPRPRPPEITA